MSTNVRIAFVGLKPKLRSILADAIAAEGDMQLIAFDPAAEWGHSDPPDAIICQVDDPLDTTLPDQLLRTAPRGCVLMVADTGDQAAVYELQPARRVFLNVSLEQLMTAIRFGLERQ